MLSPHLPGLFCLCKWPFFVILLLNSIMPLPKLSCVHCNPFGFSCPKLNTPQFLLAFPLDISHPQIWNIRSPFTQNMSAHVCNIVMDFLPPSPPISCFFPLFFPPHKGILWFLFDLLCSSSCWGDGAIPGRYCSKERKGCHSSRNKVTVYAGAFLSFIPSLTAEQRMKKSADFFVFYLQHRFISILISVYVCRYIPVAVRTPLLNKFPALVFSLSGGECPTSIN